MLSHMNMRTPTNPTYFPYFLFRVHMNLRTPTKQTQPIFIYLFCFFAHEHALPGEKKNRDSAVLVTSHCVLTRSHSFLYTCVFVCVYVCMTCETRVVPEDEVCVCVYVCVCGKVMGICVCVCV